MKREVVGLVCLVAGICFGAKLPSGYKKCNRRSSDVDRCLVQALQGVLEEADKARPEIGLLSIDPLIVSNIHIPAGTGSIVLEQTYTNANIFGVKNGQVTKMKFDFDKKIMEWEVILAPLTQIAQYVLHGKIMILPVEGSGLSNVTSESCTLHMVSPFGITENKEKKYLKFSNSQLLISSERIHFNFENLFNGNRQLGDNVNRVMNENWSEVLSALKSGLSAAYGAILEGVANSLFARVPLSEIFSDGF